MADIHTCSYECDRPACIKAQRDELRERAETAEARVRELEDQARLIVEGAIPATTSGKTMFVPAYQIDNLRAAIDSAREPEASQK